MGWDGYCERVASTRRLGAHLCPTWEEVVGWGVQSCWIGSDDGGLLLWKPVLLSHNVSQPPNVSDKAINR